LKVEAHRLAAWRDDFLAAGKQGLKGQRPDRSLEDRRLKDAERKVGQLTLENEVLRAAAVKGAAPAGEAAQVAMHRLPLAVVCRILDAPRSTIYARRQGELHRAQRGRPGRPRPSVTGELVRLIRRVLADLPFAGEGYRKVRARLRREHHVRVGDKRVLRLLRPHGLLAPQRVRGRRRPRPHDGTIIPEAPNLRWGTDATMAWTRSDGWEWMFAVVGHYTAEAWAHVAKVGGPLRRPAAGL
jgi:hypothetical protein